MLPNKGSNVKILGLSWAEQNFQKYVCNKANFLHIY